VGSSLSKAINIDLGFITKLIEDGTMSMITVQEKQIKTNFLSKEYRPIMTFLNDYYKKNGTTPTPRIFRQKFPNIELETHVDDKSMTEVVGTDEPITFWCDEVRNRAKHNKIIDIVEQMGEKLENFNTEDAFKIMTKGMVHILNDIQETTDIDVTQGGDERKAVYLKRKENKGLIGISTGIDRLDYIIKGLQKKQLITILAGTGVGKTWFLILLACFAQLNGYNVLLLTTEMSEEAILDRIEAVLFSLTTGDFNYGRFKSGALFPAEETAYFNFLDKVKPALEQMIVSTAGSVSQVSAKIDQHHPDLVLIDSAYLMEDDRGADSDWLRVAHITRDLHGVAKLKNLPVVINTQSDSTTSKKTGPELENIGYSRAIGQDSDVVIALFQDDQMREDKEMKVKVLKQREGILGYVMQNWDFTRMDFTPIYASTDGDTHQHDPSKIIEPKSEKEERGLIKYV
jgi:replicative DNA helicase